MNHLGRTLIALGVTAALAVGGAQAASASTLTTHQKNAVFAIAVKGDLRPGETVGQARHVAKSFCRLAKTSIGFDSAMVYMSGLATQNGIPQTELGVIIGAGVPVYCPRFNGDLRDFIEAHS